MPGLRGHGSEVMTEQEYGAEDAAYYRLLEARNYLTEDSSRYRRPIVTHVTGKQLNRMTATSTKRVLCSHDPGGIGDELFWQAIHTFVQDNAHKTVETIDLLRAIEKLLGVISYSLDQYVYRGGHPDFKAVPGWG